MKRRTTPPRREAMGGLAKGLDVIRAFTRESPSLTLSEIAAHARLPAATARRCLLTLTELGYVMQSGRNFLLRPKVLELGAAYLESMNIETLTKTYLEDLARRTGDSAALTVLDGTEIVYVARTSVRTLMRLEAHVGSRFPAYPTSMGRVLLAGVSPERLQNYFATEQFVALTSHTVTDPAKLMKLIEEYVRRVRPELADADLKKIRQAGVDKIQFAWAGGIQRGEGHYYRVQGPTFLLEYDNTQNNANHVHAVWRDFENDFGDDLLRKHYETAHPK